MNIEESIIEFKKMIERDKDTLRYWKSDTFGHYDEPIKKLEKDVLISETLLTAYEKEKEKNKDMSCDLTETRADNIDESTMLKQIKLKLQEKNIPIETLLAEFERLEDIEDRKVQIEYNNVFNKGVKSVEDKIKAKIEELNNKLKNADEIEAVFIIKQQQVLQSLLEKE